MMTKTRWLILGLAVSVSCNLLVAGMILGRHVVHDRHGSPSGIRAFLQNGADKTTTDLHRRIRALRDEGADTRREQVRAARRQVAQALTAQTFDRAAAAAALEQLRQLTEQNQQKIHQAMLDTYADADIEARQSAARRWQRAGSVHGVPSSACR